MAKNFVIDAAVARDLIKILDLREEMKEKDIAWAMGIIHQIPRYEKVSIARAAQDRALREILVKIAAEEIGEIKPKDLESLLEEAEEAKEKELVQKEARAKGEARVKKFVEAAKPKEPTPLAAKPEAPSVGIRIAPSLAQSVAGLAKKAVFLPITLPANYFLKAGASAVYGENKGKEDTLSGLTPFTLRAFGVESQKLKLAASAAQDSGRISGETAKKLLSVAESIRKVETGSPWYIRTVFWAYGGNQVSLITDLGKLRGGDPFRNFVLSSTGDGAGLFIKDVAGEIGQRALGGLVKKGVEGLLTKLGVSVAAEGAASVAGGPVGIAVVVIVELGKKLLSWIKRMIQEHKDVFFGAFGALLIGIGFLAGSAPLMMAGGVGLGFGAASSLGYSPGTVLSSAANAASAGIVGLASLTVASLSAAAITALVTLPVVVAIILFIINSGAYIVPPSLSTATSIESPYIGVEKKVNGKTEFENSELPIEVSYTVTVTAKKGTLTNLSFQNECHVVKEKNVPPCTAPTPEKPPAIISPIKPFVFEYKQAYIFGNNRDFRDSFITDIFTVTADSPDAKGATAATSAVIKIGAPPEECPAPWPIDSGSITQGAYSGPGNSHRSMEAIDISASIRPVFAGHSGQVVKSEFSSCLGNYIEISSSCKGKSFVSQYAHLEGTSIRSGQKVTVGQTIGLSGNTGSCTSGAHLHYRFKYLPSGDPKYPQFAPYMMPPYVPKEIPRGCGDTGSCHTSF